MTSFYVIIVKMNPLYPPLIPLILLQAWVQLRYLEADCPNQHTTPKVCHQPSQEPPVFAGSAAAHCCSQLPWRACSSSRPADFGYALECNQPGTHFQFPVTQKSTWLKYIKHSDTNAAVLLKRSEPVLFSWGT